MDLKARNGVRRILMFSLGEKKQNVIIIEWSLMNTASVFIIKYIYISENIEKTARNRRIHAIST